MLQVPGTDESLILSHRKDLEEGSDERCATLKDTRRRDANAFKEDALQMMLDGYATQSVMERPRLLNMKILYHWKQERLARSGPVKRSLEVRVREFEDGLCHAARDVLKKRLLFSAAANTRSKLSDFIG